MRSRAIRADGVSYFEDADGTRRSEGSYPSLLGFSLNIGFYQPVRRVSGLMLGAAARVALTGSQPNDGGYEEGYFYNSVTTALSAKYYPLRQRPLYFLGEIGIGAVLTKNRFLNDHEEQSYLHQFGIGPGGSVGVGYSFAPLRRDETTLDLQLLYQHLRTRVEVDEIGNYRWRSGVVQFVASLGF